MSVNILHKKNTILKQMTSNVPEKAALQVLDPFAPAQSCSTWEKENTKQLMCLRLQMKLPL